MNSSDPTLLKAIATHQAGRIAEAKAMYERILRRRANDPDALNFLGMLVFEQGDPARMAATCTQRRMSRRPWHARASSPAR